MHPNPILDALKRGETVCGMWSETGSPDLAEAAVHLGWKVVFVDNEHGVADLGEAVHLHRAVLSAGGDVILRVPSADPVHLKLVLDRGFRSIMAPMINTPEAAEAFVKACRYPPRGNRGFAAPIVRGSRYGATGNYIETNHENLLLIAQIEHVDAVENLAAIAAVDGIDALFIGPNDLAGSMGHLGHLDHPDVLAMCERVEKETLAAGKWFGSIVRPGRTARDLHECGCRLIAGPADIGLFLEGARAMLPEFDFPVVPPAPAPAKKAPAKKAPAKAATARKPAATAAPRKPSGRSSRTAG